MLGHMAGGGGHQGQSRGKKDRKAERGLYRGFWGKSKTDQDRKYKTGWFEYFLWAFGQRYYL